MEEKKNIGSLFDGIAGTYDRLNHILSLNIDKWWRKKAVRTLVQCDTVLDVAIGTGDFALEILRQHKAKSIVGIDLSKEMMRIGEQKVEQSSFKGKVRFDHGSAQEMPYDDNLYDAVTCGYGIRNFSELDKGLSEMARVMKPGGRLAILEFSYPTNPIVRFFYDCYFTHIMPLIGRMFSKDKAAYTYLNKSVKEFIWGEEMVAHLKNAGFKDVKYRPLTFGITTLYTATK